MKEEHTQSAYTGLYCLCKLAYGDLDQEIDSGIDQYLNFIKIQSETHKSNIDELLQSDQVKSVEETLEKVDDNVTQSI